MVRVLFGLTLIGLLTVAAIALGNPDGYFFDVPSIVIVLGIVGAGTLVSFPVERIRAAFGAKPDPEAVGAVFHRMADLSVSAGIFGLIIGVVQILQALDDPAALGPAMAVALLTLFYGLGLGEFVFRGLATGRPGVASTPPRDGGGSVSPYTPLTGVFLAVGVGFMMVSVLLVD